MLLRPSRETNSIFRYCVCYAAAQTGVEVHALVVMSNHWHGVVSDPEARLPEFMQILHRLVAAALNALLGRVENLWAAEAPSVVQLEHPDDVLEKLAYVIANPVAAGLVKHPCEWPGVNTTRIGEVLVAERPAGFFRDSGQMPKRTRIVCTLPPALRNLGLDVAARRLRWMAQQNVRRAKSVIRSQGRGFLGADGVRATPIYERATTPESIRRRRPVFASRDPHRRRAAIWQLRVFRAAYRVAFTRWRAGQRATRFPEGTYQLRVVHAVSCGPPLPS
jgi:hypothetical protein